MVLPAAAVFVASAVLNVALKFITPNIGALRRGIDAILFCSIYIGYTAGSSQGALYGILIALTHYVFRGAGWEYVVFVVPINALVGYLAGMFQGMDLFVLANLLFIVYHIFTFIAVGLILKKAGIGYVPFLIFNYASTVILLRIALLL